MTYEVLEFQTPIDMLLAVREKFTPYAWQVAAHVWLAGYHSPRSSSDLGPITKPTAKEPFHYTCCAANGSGKDSVIGAGFGPWFISSRPRAKCICTSASAAQLFEQTEKPCRNVADALNGLLGHKRFDYVLRTITDTRAKSEMKFFATDDPGKAEGNHPAEDYEGAEMAIMMNEVKSIEVDITDAMERNNGFNYWIEYSSPGEPMGHFWDACQITGARTRVDIVTALDCPHISKEQINKMIGTYGRNHPLVRSSLFAEFAAYDQKNLIPIEVVNPYVYVPRWKDHTLRAGLDLGLGGDEAVMYVYLGPRFVEVITCNHHDAVEVVTFFIGHIKRLGIPPENVNVDGSGIGKPMMSIFHHKGCAVKRVRNDEKTKNKAFYLNRGAEMWDNGHLILKARVVQKPKDDKLDKQLITRQVDIIGGKARLEDKRKARIAGRPSPNRADAWMLVWCNFDRSEMGIKFDEVGKFEVAEKKDAPPIVADGQIPYETLLALHMNNDKRANRFRPTTFYT